MVGYATVDIDKLNNWIGAEKEKINNHTADCWYDSLWKIDEKSSKCRARKTGQSAVTLTALHLVLFL